MKLRGKSIIKIVILSTIILVACSSKKVLYNEGVYNGTGEAYHGTIKVTVTTDQYEILDIEVIDDEPVPIVSKVVYKEIPERVIKKNSTDVDIVTGATYTSQGLLLAIEEAVKKARIVEEN